MRRTGAILAAVALSVTGLAACSGGGDQAYCDQVKSAQKNLEDFGTKAGSDLGKMSTLLGKANKEIDAIAEVAPAEIKDDWQKLGSAFDTVQPQLEKFKDVDVSDPSSIDPAKVEELQKVAQEMQKLGTEMKKTNETIQKDAKDRCDLDLS